MTTASGPGWVGVVLLCSIVAGMITAFALAAVVGAASQGTPAVGALGAGRGTPSEGPPGVPMYVPRAPISIDGDAGFVPGNGVTRGTGAPSDPYVIEGWEIEASAATGIYLANTRAHAVVRNVFVHGGDWTFDGVLLDNASSVTVEGAAFDGNAYGVVAYASTAIMIAGNRITNSLWEGILVDSSSFVEVRGNDVELSAVYAINVYMSTDVTVSGNIAFDSGFAGINLYNVERVVVGGNNITWSGVLGIALDFAWDVAILDNSVWNAEYGVDLLDSHGVVLRGNTIERTVTAASVTSSDNVTFDMNRFLLNEGGLFAAYVDDLVVAHNTFDRNIYAAGDEFGTRTTWDRGYPAGGNYWSDYGGVDLCSGPDQDVCTGPDGIGDTPYGVDADTWDRYPLMAAPSSVSPGAPLGSSVPSMLSVPVEPRLAGAGDARVRPDPGAFAGP